MTRKSVSHQHGLVGNKRPTSKMRKRRNKANLKLNIQKRVEKRAETMNKALEKINSEY